MLKIIPKCILINTQRVHVRVFIEVIIRNVVLTSFRDFKDLIQEATRSKIATRIDGRQTIEKKKKKKKKIVCFTVIGGSLKFSTSFAHTCFDYLFHVPRSPFVISRQLLGQLFPVLYRAEWLYLNMKYLFVPFSKVSFESSLNPFFFFFQ